MISHQVKGDIALFAAEHFKFVKHIKTIHLALFTKIIEQFGLTKFYNQKRSSMGCTSPYFAIFSICHTVRKPPPPFYPQAIPPLL